ncbi:MAG: pentapeptide repeat-containing protein [Cyanobacteria bacterium P01_E01_bin.42]
MANQNHLDILAKGVEIWNEWRGKNWDIDPNLRKANLSNMNLKEVDFSQTDLCEADICNTDLRETDFYLANLNGIKINEKTQLDEKWQKVWEILNHPLKNRNLREADLEGVNLGKTNLYLNNLSQANLRESDLSQANLHSASLIQSDLYLSHLCYADLNGADLSYANLGEADLSGANLNLTDLRGVNLRVAYLQEANLSEANLYDASLDRAKFRKANLTKVNLTRVQALATDFNNANLTGACIEDWHINSETKFENVICEYIYLKSEFKNGKTVYTDRRPHDSNRIFAPGDFTRLVQKATETLDLIFNDGIDWDIFATSFQSLKQERISVEGENCIFAVRTIDNLDDGSLVIRIRVHPYLDEATKIAIEQDFWAKYNPLLEVKNEKISFYREELQNKQKELKSQGNEYTKLSNTIANIIKTIAEKDRSNYDFRGAKIENLATEAKGNNFIGSQEFKDNEIIGTQYNYSSEEKQSLAEAVKEIQELLGQLSQTYPNPSPTEQMQAASQIVQHIENTPTLKEKLISAFKGGCLEFLRTNPLSAPVAGLIEGWSNAGQ